MIESGFAIVRHGRSFMATLRVSMTIFLVALFGLGPTGAVWAPKQVFAQSSLIETIEVSGSQRIDPETVQSYLLVAPGDDFDPDRLDRSLKALFGTGLFADVTMRREGATLVVAVVENPVINRVAFEGNNRIDSEDLEREVQLRPRLVFTRTKVQQDVQRILDVYRLSGRFAAEVQPKVIQLEQNRVDLVFEIDEGPLNRIRGLSFIGNRKFSDSDLKAVIQTKEYAFWRLLTTTDTYDPDRLSFDRELLRRFYLKNGYVDFKVVSAVAELTPDREDFVVTFTIEEGERYKIGNIDIDVNLKRATKEYLNPFVTTIPDEWYDANEVDTTIDQLTDELGTLGYAFVNIRPKVNQRREDLAVDVTFQVSEGDRVYVERIDIEGNVRTLDEVVRREFQLVEGDAFNTSKLRRSRRRIGNLGFFKSTKVTNAEGSSPDKTVIKVALEEQSTGQVSLGVGFSSLDGALGDIGISERNLLGRGQNLSFRFQGSAKRQEFDIGFTEPYFLTRDVAAGFDLFQVTRDRQDDSSFDERKAGGALRMAYTLAPDLRQSLKYQLRRTEIRNVKSEASRFIRDQEGKATVSQISQTLTYDKRDNRSNPTDGYVFSFTTDFAGIGGDTRFVRARLKSGYYLPILEDKVLSFLFQGGHVLGLGQDVGIAERFFVGGQQFRGFATSGLGPRDINTNDALGGNTFYIGTAEFTFPIGLPEDLGFKASVFTDVGSLWNIDSTGSDIFDSSAIRVAAGAGLGWATAFGLIRIDLTTALSKEDKDETEFVRFSFGTRF
jgi:outer membrane protein insertion porin family